MLQKLAPIGLHGTALRAFACCRKGPKHGLRAGLSENFHKSWPAQPSAVRCATCVQQRGRSKDLPIRLISIGCTQPKSSGIPMRLGLIWRPVERTEESAINCDLYARHISKPIRGIQNFSVAFLNYGGNTSASRPLCRKRVNMRLRPEHYQSAATCPANLARPQAQSEMFADTQRAMLIVRNWRT